MSQPSDDDSGTNAPNYVARNRSSSYAGTEIRKRKSLNAIATIVPEEDKFQKLKNVRLAGFIFLAKTTNWYTRVFWITLISLSFIFLTYEVYRTIMDFIDNPVITTYVLKPLEQIAFPKLFICPSVVVSKAYFDRYPAKAAAALRFLENSELLSSNNTNMKPDNNMSNSEFDEQSGNSMRDEVMAMGLKLDDFFIACSFYGNGSDYEQLNCNDIATPVFDHRFGKCFQVGINQNQTTDGKALSLTLNSQSFSQEVNDTKFTKPYQGVFVTVDSQYQPTSTDYVLVPSGSYTKVAFSLTHFTFLNLLSGSLIQPCAEPLVARLGVLNARYTQSSCRMECLLNESVSVCGCALAVDQSVLKKSLTLCSVAQYRTCLNPHLSSKNQRRLNECKNGCQSPCEDFRYESSTSGAPLNPDAFDTEQSAREMVLLDVAFDHVETAHFSQSSSMTFNFFVGNMGSQITLWIGGCMLTLIPLPLSIIAFCCMACVVRIQRYAFGRNEDE